MCMLSERRVKRYFDLAENASCCSDFHGTKKVKLGSVLIYKGKVMSVGWNTDKSSPIQKQFNALRDLDTTQCTVRHGTHSEMLCLIRAKDLEIDFSKASLFTYRKKRDGTAGNAKPCPACAEYIKQLGIKNIYYTTDEGYAYEKRG